MSKKRVLILTDSLGLPREKPESCSYEDTWPILLRNAGFDIHQVSIGGATSTDLLKQVFYHKCFNPDIVIVQVGIVDCAPRFMTQFELELFRRIKFIGHRIISRMNTFVVKKLRKITYVHPDLFKQNIDAIEGNFQGIPVYFLGILPASLNYESILPGIVDRVNQFNRILETKKYYISTSEIDKIGIMSDYHHLNAIGHKEVFDLVYSEIYA